MRIGELAKLTGLAPSRIRFYEASGLISSVERKANGYRDYDADAVWVLEMITNAQAAGFSLEEIRRLLPAKARAGSTMNCWAGSGARSRRSNAFRSAWHATRRSCCW